MLDKEHWLGLPSERSLLDTLPHLIKAFKDSLETKTWTILLPESLPDFTRPFLVRVPTDGFLYRVWVRWDCGIAEDRVDNVEMPWDEFMKLYNGFDWAYVPREET